MSSFSNNDKIDQGLKGALQVDRLESGALQLNRH